MTTHDPDVVKATITPEAVRVWLENAGKVNNQAKHYRALQQISDNSVAIAQAYLRQQEALESIQRQVNQSSEEMITDPEKATDWAKGYAAGHRNALKRVNQIINPTPTQDGER